jgi:hypothetical protein
MPSKGSRRVVVSGLCYVLRCHGHRYGWMRMIQFFSKFDYDKFNES